MATSSERAHIVWWYAESNSVIQVRRRFPCEYNKDCRHLRLLRNCVVSLWPLLKGHEGRNPGIHKEAIENVCHWLHILEHAQAFYCAHIQLTIISQQHGAPPHWSYDFRDYLKETFPNRWIWRDGSIPWSSHSSDVIILDFFLLRKIKDKHKLQELTA
ncbi:hypothetical protein ANN_14104 [Periplaneta americana]|uniref:DUF4817 domain-containing protein n=1 Tax=Periplaneta americana TaxID=6978 RepID=A0ABQ8SXI8_PERAM|nr:hypothetical protein ANN_14104 [Periplaneta americana]